MEDGSIVLLYFLATDQIEFVGVHIENNDFEYNKNTSARLLSVTYQVFIFR
jgi:hypothetical protein